MELDSIKRSNMSRVIKSKEFYALTDEDTKFYEYLQKIDAIKYLKAYTSNDTKKMRKFYFKGGQNYVDYGINAFVREIYCYPFTNLIVFCDRNENFYHFNDESISDIILNSNVFITSEGFIIFYAGNFMYITLNGKFGTIIDTTSYGDINNIFSNEYGTTIIEFYENFMSVYYQLVGNLIFINSYGKQMNLYLEKIEQDYDLIKPNIKIEVTDDMCGSIRYNRTLDNSSDGFKRLYKKEIKMLCPIDYKMYIDTYLTVTLIFLEKSISNSSDPLNPCINSFVRTLLLTSFKIKKKFSLSRSKNAVDLSGWKYYLILHDRNNNPMYINLEKHTYASLNDEFLKFYISSEGIIAGIKASKIVISLDGILWHTYDLRNIISDSSLFDNYDSIELSVHNKKNYLTFNYKNDKKEIPISFTFDFWNLYGSPVELHILDHKVVDDDKVILIGDGKKFFK